MFGHEALRRLTRDGFGERRIAVVQRERRAFDFEQHARMRLHHVGEHAFHAQQTLVVEAEPYDVAARVAPLCAMQARNRQIGQIGHAEIAVNAVDATARYDGHSPFRQAAQLRQRFDQRLRHQDAVRCRGDLDERTVEIEEKRGLARRQGGG